jgi:hypothetical protein
MALNLRHLVTLGLVASLGSAAAAAAERDDWFQEGLRLDLTGGPTGASQAFALYRRAAEAGLPEAQFNVAVMLDSGRGVTADMREAAIWYARAAANGNRRAAFNLGQLYQSGDGVPRNLDLARQWFARSSLPAARARLVALPRDTGSRVLSAPTLSAPPAGTHIAPDATTVVLVWTAEPQPATARFYVEVRDASQEPPRTLVADFVEQSSLAVTLPAEARAIDWRVFSVDPAAGLYRATAWSRIVRG